MEWSCWLEEREGTEQRLGEEEKLEEVESRAAGEEFPAEEGRARCLRRRGKLSDRKGRRYCPKVPEVSWDPWKRWEVPQTARAQEEAFEDLRLVPWVDQAT